jgi:hypothetical protein
MVLKSFVAFVIAALVMAILVPALHKRGVSLQGWMVWGVIVSSFAICLGPDVLRRWRARRA